MPIAPKHAFKEKSTKLLIFLPHRTIYFLTFQCETPCTVYTLYSVHLFPILRALWILSLFRYCELQFHNTKIFSATVHTAIKSKGAMKRNIAFRKFDQFSSSICPIHLRMNIFYKIHKSLVRFSAHFRSINCREQKVGLTLQFSLRGLIDCPRLSEISEKNWST